MNFKFQLSGLRLRSLYFFKNLFFTKPGTGLKLHLGCGRDYLKGYVNIDLDPNALSDLKINYTQIKKHFRKETVAEVLMIHSISYLNLWQARDFFHDVLYLLENGGKLILEFPNIEKCAQRLIDSKNDLNGYIEAVRGIYAFDLNQIANKEKYTPYSFGWSALHIQFELEKSGFKEIRLLAPQTHKHPWRDLRIEAVK